MNNEPALNNAKSKLEQAIQAAESAKERTPKLSDSEIEAAKNAIVDAENEAKEVINRVNQDKENLKTNIQNKADEIKNYLDTLTKPQYDEFKEVLKRALDNYNANDKNNLDSKTKADLEKLLNDLTKNLSDAKKSQAEKDSEIATDNKSKLVASKNGAKLLADSITSQDPEMVALKEKLNQGIQSAEKVINDQTESKYVSEKEKLDEIKLDAETKKQAFDQKLNTEKSNHAEKLQQAREKLDALLADNNSPNYTNLLNDLRTIIGANNTINNNDPIAEINKKTEALNNAIIAADAAKITADATTNQKLSDLKAQIDASNNTKTSMASEPSLENAMNTLSNAIATAQNAYNHAPKKLTDSEIQQAKEALKRAEDAAKREIQRVNNEKTQLKSSIASKEEEIESYLATLNNQNYSEFKQTLQDALDNYRNTNKNNLDNKVKSDLSDILRSLSQALESAKNAQAQKDNETSNNNKQALITSKDTLKAKANSITSTDPKMVELKKQLNNKVAEAETIIANQTANQYVSKKAELDNLAREADQKISEFSNKWNEADRAQKEALRLANEKSALLSENKYSEIKAELDRIINQNDDSNENLPIDTIKAKTTALNNAVKNANINKAKHDAKAIIDGLTNLSTTRRQQLKNDIDSVSNTKEEADAIDEINNKVLADRKENYNTFIDNIPYPSTGRNASIASNTKQNLKNRLVNALTTNSTSNDFKTLETKLNSLNGGVSSLTTKINALPDGEIKNRLTSELAATTDQNYDALKNKIDKAKNILDLINQITHANVRDASAENLRDHFNLVNTQIDALKESLKQKLANANDNNLNNLEDLVRKDKQVVDTLKSTFRTDILVAKKLIEELKTKNSAAEAQTVSDKIAGINEQLLKFWNPREGNGTNIRLNKNNYPKNASSVLKSYETLRDDYVRSATSADQLKNINDNITPLYIKAIDFNNKIKNINSSIMPDSVKNALKNKLLEQNTLAGMNDVTKYVEEPNAGNNVTTGWYKDAYNTINTIGNQTNKSELLAELKAADRTPGRDVLENINTIRRKINEYKIAFDTAKTKLEQYSTNVNKNSDKYNELLRELNNTVNNKEKADSLKTKIEEAIKLANKKAELKTLLNEVQFPNRNNAPAKATLSSRIDSLNSMQSANELSTQITNLKNAISGATTKVNNLPYPKSNAQAKNNIKSDLNGAISAEDVNRILPSTWSNDIKEYKRIIEGLSPTRQGLRDERLNKTYPSSTNSATSVEELRKQIIETYKVDIKEKINSIANMSESEKRPFIRDIEAVVSINVLTMDELRQKVETIKRQYDLALQERFRLAKEAAKNALDNYKQNPDKENSRIKGLEDRLNALTAVEHTDNAIALKNEIDGLINSANSLRNKKNTIKAIIDRIPYPNPQSTEAQTAKRELKADVDSLTTMQSLNQKETEINELKNLMKTKVDLINGSIGYTTNNAPAIDTIKNKLNSAKTQSDINDALPNDWNHKLGEYKLAIDHFFDTPIVNNIAEIKNNLLKRFNQTVPDSISTANYKETNLRNEILHEAKEAAKAFVNNQKNLSNLSAEQKRDIISRINRETLPERGADTNMLLSKLTNIQGYLNGALRTNYNVFIDRLQYPSSQNASDQINTDSRNTKETIKRNLTANISIETKSTVESNLNDLASDISTLRTEISNVKPVAKQTDFNSEFSTTDNTGIRNLIQTVRNYKNDYESKKREAAAAISQVNDSTVRSDLEKRLNNDANTIETLARIKDEAVRQKNQELDSARREANAIIDSINYPGGNNSQAISSLKRQVSQANNIETINELNRQNNLIKEAVKSAVSEIDKISDNNPKKSQLKEQLNSAVNIDGQNGIDDIKRKAIEAQKADIQSKKQELINEINKLPSSSDKKNLLDKAELSKTEEEFSKIRSEIATVSRKIELRKEVDKLALFNLSNNRGGLPNEFVAGANDATKYNLKDLYKLITNASSDSELNTISEKINQQRNAELNDLRKTRLESYGNWDNDNSAMKLELNQSLSIAVNDQGKDSTGTLTSQYINEYNALNEQIRSADTIEKYKAAKIKAEKFIAKYESKDTKKWLPFFKQRVDSHYKKHPADAGPYNVTIPLSSWSHIISEFEKQDTDRAGAIRTENQALYDVYYKYRRNAKLNYEFLKLIARVKDSGIVDDSARYQLDQLKSNYEGVISAEEKNTIIANSNKQLFGSYNVSEWWARTSQMRFLNWWAQKIANAPEGLISQDEKYKLLDEIALNTDSTDKLFLDKWRAFKDKFYNTTLIASGELDSDGYPKNAKPYIWK